MRAVQRLRDDIVAEREAFATWQATVDGDRVVCVDESGIVAGGRVGYGYAPRGERCEEHAPYRRGRRTNLVGWLGLGRGGVVAVQGHVDGAFFERFVREHLGPSLTPGDVVVWDNHSIHRSAELRRLIEARGAQLAPQPALQPGVQRVRGDVVEGEARGASGTSGHAECSGVGAVGLGDRSAVGGLGGMAAARRLRPQLIRVALYLFLR